MKKGTAINRTFCDAVFIEQTQLVHKSTDILLYFGLFEKQSK